jgi:hypothetical protein
MGCAAMSLAALFWFYSQPDVCRRRVSGLRRRNPRLQIYGLYGGPPATWPYELGLDDVYEFDHSKDAEWKWRNGDLMIADWHQHRGRYLGWSHIAVIQWDLLVLAPLERAFGGGDDAVVLSGARPVSSVAGWWPWVLGENEAEYRRFASAHAAPWCCLFITQRFPRAFLDAYTPTELGFVEYRLPTLARELGFRVEADPLNEPWWAADPATTNMRMSERVLNGVNLQPSLGAMAKAYLRGRRVFHPYRR